jgi:ADP-ribose pyrophosphatase
MAFEVTHTEKIFEGRAFSVRQDQVRMPDGRNATLDVVVHRGSVTLIPVDQERQIWFVRQYRHPVGKELLELPAGVVEAGERPEVTAQREIQEEIGMAASTLHFLGSFFLAPGYSTEYMYVYLAEGLYESALQPDEDEHLQVEKISVEAAYHSLEAGKLEDAKTLAALALARSHLCELTEG